MLYCVDSGFSWVGWVTYCVAVYVIIFARYYFDLLGFAFCGRIECTWFIVFLFCLFCCLLCYLMFAGWVFACLFGFGGGLFARFDCLVGCDCLCIVCLLCLSLCG